MTRTFLRRSTLDAIDEESAQASWGHGPVPVAPERAAMVLMEEVGELIAEILEVTRRPLLGWKSVKLEAIQVASVAARIAEKAENDWRDT